MYFKEKAAPIIHKAEQNKIYIKNKFQNVDTQEIGIPFMNNINNNIKNNIDKNIRENINFKQKFIQATKIKKLHLDSNIILSGRELDCARLLLQGKTASETARELFISSRTVETHLSHIKDKLNCRTKSELISRLSKNSLM